MSGKQLDAYIGMCRAAARVLLNGDLVVDAFAVPLRKVYGLDLANDAEALARVLAPVEAIRQRAQEERRPVKLSEIAQLAYDLVGCPESLRQLRGRTLFRGLEGHADHATLRAWDLRRPGVAGHAANQRIRASETKRRRAAAEARIAAAEDGRFEPDWASPPGDTIRDWLDLRAMSVEAGAEALGLSVETFGALLVGSVPIDDELARKLASVFRREPDGDLEGQVAFWLARERNYVETLGRLGKRRPGTDVPDPAIELDMGRLEPAHAG